MHGKKPNTPYYRSFLQQMEVAAPQWRPSVDLSDDGASEGGDAAPAHAKP